MPFFNVSCYKYCDYKDPVDVFLKYNDIFSSLEADVAFQYSNKKGEKSYASEKDGNKIDDMIKSDRMYVVLTLSVEADDANKAIELFKEYCQNLKEHNLDLVVMEADKKLAQGYINYVKGLDNDTILKCTQF